MTNPPTEWLQALTKYLASSIRYKIIVPYALLTLVLAGLGVFVITRLVAIRFEDRLKNQLLEAGRVVSDEVVNQERQRLEVERLVANTEGVADALVDRDFVQLDELVSPIIANYRDVDSVALVDTQGKEVLRLQREPLGPNAPAQVNRGSGADFFGWSSIRRVLSGANEGAKEVQLALDPNSNELIIYTIGAVQLSDGIVGATLVGTYLKKEIEAIHNLALADVTLFEDTGRVVYSTLVPDNTEAQKVFKIFTAERYQQVLKAGDVTLLDEIQAPDGAPLPQEVVARGRTYRLAYAPYLLRNQVYGVYAVALPTNFITETNDQNRNILAAIFAGGVVLVFGIGYWVSQRIIHPITRLVQTSQAIARGNLDQRSGLKQPDEIGILADTFDNMTSKLQALLKMQREEASRLTAILSSIADGVIVQDMAGRIVTLNPAAERILKALEGDDFTLEPGHITGEVHPATFGDLGAILLNQLTGLNFHETRRFEVNQQAFSALSAPVLTPDQDQQGSVVVLRDITREVESEKLKDDFITSMSHELRTPLTAIKGYNHLLRLTGAGKFDERQRGFIETIERNIGELEQLIQQMLDLSQIYAGNLGIDQERVNFSELIESEADKWSPMLEDKELSLTIHAPQQQLWIEGDRNRLGWVLDNLLRNAHDYTLPGGSVELWVKVERGFIHTDVKDTGVGIAPKDQRFLFTRFFRAIHADGTFEVSGAGLGLYISKAIVEAHQGQIWMARSELNHGSTFSFTLPLLKVGSEEPEETLLGVEKVKPDSNLDRVQ
ncbi:MAG: ATP-binding protein [Anaerolineae bacterium]